MKRINLLMFILIIIGSFQLAACSPKPANTEKVSPVQIEPIDGTDLKRVILTEKAAQRINLQTVPANGTVVPYAAVIYDTEGNTWLYTNPAPLTFVREAITIEHIEGDEAVLSKGLASEAPIVTVGVAELYGAETGVSK